jgi:hypothetical protein
MIFGRTVVTSNAATEHVCATVVNNASTRPVYDVIIRWHMRTAPWIHEGVAHEDIPRLIAGGIAKRERTWLGTEFPDSFGAVVEFRDAAGVRWRCTNDGQLEELRASPR